MKHLASLCFIWANWAEKNIDRKMIHSEIGFALKISDFKLISQEIWTVCLDFSSLLKYQNRKTDCFRLGLMMHDQVFFYQRFVIFSV